TRLQVLPSAELQTSRGGGLYESNQPPRIQSRSLKTTSPLESRGCQPALSVSRTQSGVGPSARTEGLCHTRTPTKTPKYFMSQVPPSVFCALSCSRYTKPLGSDTESRRSYSRWKTQRGDEVLSGFLQKG